MKSIFLIFVCTIFFISCGEENKINDKFISKFNYPPNKNLLNRNDLYMFFVCIENNKFTYLPNKFLFEIYENEYKSTYNTYKDFLIDLYLNKICLKENLTNFELDYSINNQIMGYDLETLVNKFKLKKDDNNLILLEKSKLDSKTIHNIAYNLFKKDYLISYDDYSGNLKAISFSKNEY